LVIISSIVSGSSNVGPPGSRLRMSATMSGKVETNPLPPLCLGTGRK